ncbi:MAG: 4-alpha-glucanotransferase [Gammaproteobacteria bacterium]|jgi:4-alpha-glucanotransferase|nr:4-alpha-glucanotransferase [Gammaproteobacteria bacterium]MBT5221383.1 4-alpha-glucanotransferase [Gammaproteobacteria bacterium]MBT5825962.1 4-alpha-glucanotransferase [Gammaproteobacteria bacterium]MBT6419772.1 4-alpha-glucanotransferase [Gammaproteobacteria bacterium]MBT6574953.1 4-alpha-glucanotransferase [Gammaproteobacteria bacterium]
MLEQEEDLLAQRRAGVLLHITSLPNDHGSGNLGKEAYNFVNFLHTAGIKVWQTLPLGVPHGDGSPYQCLSAHAGNPALICLEELKQKGWLQEAEQYDICEAGDDCGRDRLIAKAHTGFENLASAEEQQAYLNFCTDKSSWLDDYALFYALHNERSQQCWNQWPSPLKERKPAALKAARKRMASAIEMIKFEQFLFFRQWMALKEYANSKNVLLFGDIPIFVSYDSADVWANRKVFKLDERGEMSVVAGVPPDYFSVTGQRWGNPHYDWPYLIRSKFSWWNARLRSQLEMFDILRIDHFRGFEAAWEIPADEDTAINGEWVKAPGKSLLAALQKEFGKIPLVAEDLGIITAEVDELRMDFNLPGMKVLQFAFGDDDTNPYLPHNYDQNCVVYTGTHDNDTTVGWYNCLNDHEKHRVYSYLGHPQATMPYLLIGTAFSSVANLAIVPMQDILELGGEHRMNIPGTVEGNWKWQFSWEQLKEGQLGKLSNLVRMFTR